MATHANAAASSARIAAARTAVRSGGSDPGIGGTLAQAIRAVRTARTRGVALTLANLAASAFMTGVIWFVQLVHYPLMARVGWPAWPAYEREHRVRTTAVVGLPMLALPALAVALLVAAPAGSGALAGATLLALAVAPLVVTAVASVPAHDRLEVAWSDDAHRRLVGSNWLRTAAWTAHTGVSVAVAAAVA